MSVLMLGANKIISSALFTISATPELQEDVRGTTVTYTVTLTRLNFDAPVTLNVIDVPSGVTATLSPNTLSGATLTSTLTIVIGNDAVYTTDTLLTIIASGINAPTQFATVALSVLETPEPPPSQEWSAGPNAPQWVTGTNYREELFTTDIPVYSRPNAPPAAPSGWYGFNGFPGITQWSNFTNSFREVVYNPGPRVAYPVMQTPIGEKKVFQFTYPGSSHTINGVSQATTAWPTWQNTGVAINGSWSGTLVFEISADNGVTWEPVTLTGQFRPGLGSSVTGTQSTVNGVWALDNTQSGGRYMEWGNDGKYLRIRASSWTSGTATVTVGMKGGEEAVFAQAGTLTGKKMYVRYLARLDPDFTSVNAETKGFFIRTNASGSNHYWFFIGRPDASNDGYAQLGVQLQSSWSFNRYQGPRGPANGEWLDIELQLEMNTAGQANGIGRGWINGVQLLNATNIPWTPSTVDGVFTNVSLIPTYGGGKQPPPRNCIVQLGAWYLEVTT